MSSPKKLVSREFILQRTTMVDENCHTKIGNISLYSSHFECPPNSKLHIKQRLRTFMQCQSIKIAATLKFDASYVSKKKKTLNFTFTHDKGNDEHSIMRFSNIDLDPVEGKFT